MNIAQLRKEMPAWSWTAEHYGMGYRYIGKRSDESVMVYAVARLCGPAEDDFSTEWRVDVDGTSMSYAAWWIREAA